MSDQATTHSVVRCGKDCVRVRRCELVTRKDQVVFTGNLKACRTFVRRWRPQKGK